MNKLIALLLLFPFFAFASENGKLDVETAYKAGTNFLKKDTEYYSLKSYVKGVLEGYAELKYKIEFSQEDDVKIFSCQKQIESGESQIFGCLNKILDQKKVEDIVQSSFAFVNYKDKRKIKQCLLSQIPEHALTRVFYGYVEGKIQGNTLLSKALIEENERYCYQKLKENKEKETEHQKGTGKQLNKPSI